MHLEEGQRDRHGGSQRLLKAGDAPISHGKGKEVAATAPAPHDTIALSLQPPKHQGIHSGFFSILGFAQRWQKASEKPSKVCFCSSQGWKGTRKMLPLWSCHLKCFLCLKKTLVFLPCFPNLVSSLPALSCDLFLSISQRCTHTHAHAQALT